MWAPVQHDSDPSQQREFGYIQGCEDTERKKVGPLQAVKMGFQESSLLVH